ncbi:MAG: 2-C-methyl-D-erythritol 4-phosphate cytidylyltransferase [Acidimicrobiia bacterium]
MSVWAIVVAAGRGVRFGVPDGTSDAESRKQFVELAGMSVVEWAVRTSIECCDGVVLVLPADALEGGPRAAVDVAVDAVVAGGATRADSVRAGLAAVPAEAEVVVVHDAARPLASPALFAAVVEAVRAGADAAVPALPVTDTVKRVVGNRVEATVARDDLVVVQTPQAFRAAALRAAHAGASDASDDAALVERAGGAVVVVPGDADNLKITTPVDLVVAGVLLGDRTDGGMR